MSINESERMVEEAYEAIAAIHSIPLVRVKKVPDYPGLAEAGQLLSMGLITRRKYMEMFEEEAFPEIWVEP